MLLTESKKIVSGQSYRILKYEKYLFTLSNIQVKNFIYNNT